MELKVDDIKQLKELVSEQLGALEPGLTPLDSDAHLGGSTIDIVAADATGTLTLIAVGFVADDEIVLRALEAYSWCTEYPAEVQRLYPSVRASGGAPRVVFVVESRTDGFLRKLKHVRFERVECVEFRVGLSFTRLDAPAGSRVAAPPPAPHAASGASESPAVTGAPAVRTPPHPSRPAAPPAAVPTAAAIHAEPVEVPSGAEARAPGLAAVSPPARGVEEAKVSVVREYLQKEFPTTVIYDYYVPERGAHVFDLQDNQGVIVYSAAIVEDLLNGTPDAQLRQFFDKHKLGRLMRQAGQAGVLVTKSGLKIERR